MRFSSLETSYKKTLIPLIEYRSRDKFLYSKKSPFHLRLPKTYVTIANWIRATFTSFDTIGMTWAALDTDRENSTTGHKAVICFVEFTLINAFFIVFVTVASTSSPKIIVSKI